MGKILALCIALLLYFSPFCQLPLHMVLPMGVIGDGYGDTLMNTSAILKREGIRKITALQSSPEKTKTFSSITHFLNPNGKVTVSSSCIRPQKNDTGFCVSDTFFYDSSGRVIELRSRDAKGNLYVRCKTEYEPDGRVKRTWIWCSPQKTIGDTDIHYGYFNEKGRLIRSEYVGEKFSFQTASLFYHSDGLLDSIRHDNPSVGTYIFNRKERQKATELTLETATQSYKWVYNPAGQCISSEWQAKDRSVYHNSKSVENIYGGKTSYHFNANGTLSEVVLKRGSKKVSSLTYLYER